MPDEILAAIFKDAGKDKGPIPIRGTINGTEYTQTLVRYSGDWRLYINTLMFKNSLKRIGEVVAITVAFDPKERTIKMHPLLAKALGENSEAKKVFDSLPPSRSKEIVRYISNLKTEESIINNIEKGIRFMEVREGFAARDKP